MKRFKHLNYTDRLMIEKLLVSGMTKSQIALCVGCSYETIRRECKRGQYLRLNSDYTNTAAYSADIAQRDYNYKSTVKGANLKIGNNHELATFIEDRILNDKYSPDAVLAEIKNRFGYRPFCTTTLYSYISKGIFLHLQNADLPEKSKRKRKYVKLIKLSRPQRGPSIEIRAPEILNREIFGHWEMDTVIGQRNGKESALLVLTERKTRYEIIMKIARKASADVVNALDSIEKRFTSGIFKSITIDNGTEFQTIKECYIAKTEEKEPIYTIVTHIVVMNGVQMNA